MFTFPIPSPAIRASFISQSECQFASTGNCASAKG